MTILGITLAAHESGAAIVRDGRILAAANEERFSREKADSAPPYQAIESVLETAGLNKSDIDMLAFSDMKFGWKRNWHFFRQQGQRVWYTYGRYLKSFLNPKTFTRGRFLKQIGLLALKRGMEIEKATREIVSDFRKQGFKGKVRFVDHDVAHAATAYYTSGREDSFVAVVEGSSFRNSCSFWQKGKESLVKVGEVVLPHSPGRYYETVTLILGFNPKRHGGKITGLAGFGDSKKCYDRVASLLYFKKGRIRVSPRLYCLHDEYFARGKCLPRLFENEKREDIAAAFQKRLEDVILEQINFLAQKHHFKNLALAGGVFANVKLNMEIANLPWVENIYIHPGMGDVGQPLGAALQAYADYDRNFKPFYLKDVYFGPSWNDREIEKALKEQKLKFERSGQIAQRTAQILAQNKVVGFFQGRMEYGPRALGNRSILYPAVDYSVNDWLNQRLKRTEFMPFAPVTLKERAGDCYKGLDKCGYTAKFMTIALETTNYMKKNMPAAVHIDGTARPQLIDQETNPIYYQVLKEYEKITGLPSIINTSFNMHEEPIVCSPQQAIKAYQASHLDALVMGNYLVL